MNKILSFLGLVALAVCLFVSCGKATLETGGAYAPASTNLVDVTVAKAFYDTDLSYKVAWSAINVVFEFERNNRAYLWQLDPKIKHTLDGIRPKAVDLNSRYLAARAIYLTAPQQTGLDTLHAILGDLQAIVTSIQAVLPPASLTKKA